MVRGFLWQTVFLAGLTHRDVLKPHEIKGQSFVINPFPRRFELVLVEKIIARAATEIGLLHKPGMAEKVALLDFLVPFIWSVQDNSAFGLGLRGSFALGCLCVALRQKGII